MCRRIRLNEWLGVTDDAIAAKYSSREEANEVFVRAVVLVEALLAKFGYRRISQRPIHFQSADQDGAPRFR